MNLGLYASKIQAEVLAERAALDKAYRDYPDANHCWCLVDLVQSSNYRLDKGPERGYIRGESFFALVKAATRPYVTVRIFKEIGDAVLMYCPTFRPLLESGTLLIQAAKQLAYVAGDRSYPFAVRLGIESGVAKRLSRRHEDYLGEPIDRLARIMTVRSEKSDFLIGESAFDPHRKILDEYRRILEVSPPMQLKLTGGKVLNEQVYYREVYLNEDHLAEFSDYFFEWQRGVHL